MPITPDYLVLADEINILPSNTAVRLTSQAQRTIVGALRMVEKVHIVMAALGHNGSICARDDRVQAVMDCLHEIDPR